VLVYKILFLHSLLLQIVSAENKVTILYKYSQNEP
jgi:hypothetical protein